MNEAADLEEAVLAAFADDPSHSTPAVGSSSPRKRKERPVPATDEERLIIEEVFDANWLIRSYRYFRLLELSREMHEDRWEDLYKDIHGYRLRVAGMIDGWTPKHGAKGGILQMYTLGELKQEREQLERSLTGLKVCNTWKNRKKWKKVRWVTMSKYRCSKKMLESTYQECLQEWRCDAKTNRFKNWMLQEAQQPEEEHDEASFERSTTLGREERKTRRVSTGNLDKKSVTTQYWLLRSAEPALDDGQRALPLRCRDLLKQIQGHGNILKQQLRQSQKGVFLEALLQALTEIDQETGKEVEDIYRQLDAAIEDIQRDQKIVERHRSMYGNDMAAADRVSQRLDVQLKTILSAIHSESHWLGTLRATSEDGPLTQLRDVRKKLVELDDKRPFPMLVNCTTSQRGNSSDRMSLHNSITPSPSSTKSAAGYGRKKSMLSPKAQSSPQGDNYGASRKTSTLPSPRSSNARSPMPSPRSHGRMGKKSSMGQVTEGGLEAQQLISSLQEPVAAARSLGRTIQQWQSLALKRINQVSKIKGERSTYLTARNKALELKRKDLAKKLQSDQAAQRDFMLKRWLAFKRLQNQYSTEHIMPADKALWQEQKAQSELKAELNDVQAELAKQKEKLNNMQRGFIRTQTTLHRHPQLMAKSESVKKHVEDTIETNEKLKKEIENIENDIARHDRGSRLMMSDAISVVRCICDIDSSGAKKLIAANPGLKFLKRDVEERCDDRHAHEKTDAKRAAAVKKLDKVIKKIEADAQKRAEKGGDDESSNGSDSSNAEEGHHEDSNEVQHNHVIDKGTAAKRFAQAQAKRKMMGRSQTQPVSELAAVQAESAPATPHTPTARRQTKTGESRSSNSAAVANDVSKRRNTKRQSHHHIDLNLKHDDHHDEVNHARRQAAQAAKRLWKEEVAFRKAQNRFLVVSKHIRNHLPPDQAKVAQKMLEDEVEDPFGSKRLAREHTQLDQEILHMNDNMHKLEARFWAMKAQCHKEIEAADLDQGAGEGHSLLEDDPAPGTTLLEQMAHEDSVEPDMHEEFSMTSMTTAPDSEAETEDDVTPRVRRKPSFMKNTGKNGAMWSRIKSEFMTKRSASFDVSADEKASGWDLLAPGLAALGRRSYHYEVAPEADGEVYGQDISRSMSRSEQFARTRWEAQKRAIKQAIDAQRERRRAAKERAIQREAAIARAMAIENDVERARVLDPLLTYTPTWAEAFEMQSVTIKEKTVHSRIMHRFKERGVFDLFASSMPRDRQKAQPSQQVSKERRYIPDGAAVEPEMTDLAVEPEMEGNSQQTPSRKGARPGRADRLISPTKLDLDKEAVLSMQMPSSVKQHQPRQRSKKMVEPRPFGRRPNTPDLADGPQGTDAQSEGSTDHLQAEPAPFAVNVLKTFMVSRSRLRQEPRQDGPGKGLTVFHHEFVSKNGELIGRRTDFVNKGHVPQLWSLREERKKPVAKQRCQGREIHLRWQPSRRDDKAPVSSYNEISYCKVVSQKVEGPGKVRLEIEAFGDSSVQDALRSKISWQGGESVPSEDLSSFHTNEAIPEDEASCIRGCLTFEGVSTDKLCKFTYGSFGYSETPIFFPLSVPIPEEPVADAQEISGSSSRLLRLNMLRKLISQRDAHLQDMRWAPGRAKRCSNSDDSMSKLRELVRVKPALRKAFVSNLLQKITVRGILRRVSTRRLERGSSVNLGEGTLSVGFHDYVHSTDHSGNQERSTLKALFEEDEEHDNDNDKVAELPISRKSSVVQESSRKSSQNRTLSIQLPVGADDEANDRRASTSSQSSRRSSRKRSRQVSMMMDRSDSTKDLLQLPEGTSQRVNSRSLTFTLWIADEDGKEPESNPTSRAASRRESRHHSRSSQPPTSGAASRRQSRSSIAFSQTLTPTSRRASRERELSFSTARTISRSMSRDYFVQRSLSRALSRAESVSFGDSSMDDNSFWDQYTFKPQETDPIVHVNNPHFTQSSLKETSEGQTNEPRRIVRRLIEDRAAAQVVSLPNLRVSMRKSRSGSPSRAHSPQSDPEQAGSENAMITVAPSTRASLSRRTRRQDTIMGRASIAGNRLLRESALYSELGVDEFTLDSSVLFFKDAIQEIEEEAAAHEEMHFLSDLSANREGSSNAKEIQTIDTPRTRRQAIEIDKDGIEWIDLEALVEVMKNEGQLDQKDGSSGSGSATDDDDESPVNPAGVKEDGAATQEASTDLTSTPQTAAPSMQDPLSPTKKDARFRRRKAFFERRRSPSFKKTKKKSLSDRPQPAPRVSGVQHLISQSDSQSSENSLPAPSPQNVTRLRGNAIGLASGEQPPEFFEELPEDRVCRNNGGNAPTFKKLSLMLIRFAQARKESAHKNVTEAALPGLDVHATASAEGDRKSVVSPFSASSSPDRPSRWSRMRNYMDGFRFSSRLTASRTSGLALSETLKTVAEDSSNGTVLNSNSTSLKSHRHDRRVGMVTEDLSSRSSAESSMQPSDIVRQRRTGMVLRLKTSDLHEESENSDDSGETQHPPASAAQSEAVIDEQITGEVHSNAQGKPLSEATAEQVGEILSSVVESAKEPGNLVRLEVATKQSNRNSLKLQELVFPVLEGILSPILCRQGFEEVTVEELLRQTAPVAKCKKHIEEIAKITIGDLSSLKVAVRKSLSKAAIDIQRVLRGKKARKEVKQMREEAAELAAPTDSLTEAQKSDHQVTSKEAVPTDRSTEAQKQWLLDGESMAVAMKEVQEKDPVGNATSIVARPRASATALTLRAQLALDQGPHTSNSETAERDPQQEDLSMEPQQSLLESSPSRAALQFSETLSFCQGPSISSGSADITTAPSTSAVQMQSSMEDVYEGTTSFSAFVEASSSTLLNSSLMEEDPSVALALEQHSMPMHSELMPSRSFNEEPERVATDSPDVFAAVQEGSTQMSIQESKQTTQLGDSDKLPPGLAEILDSIDEADIADLASSYEQAWRWESLTPMFDQPPKDPNTPARAASVQDQGSPRLSLLSQDCPLFGYDIPKAPERRTGSALGNYSRGDWRLRRSGEVAIDDVRPGGFTSATCNNRSSLLPTDIEMSELSIEPLHMHSPSTLGGVPHATLRNSTGGCLSVIGAGKSRSPVPELPSMVASKVATSSMVKGCKGSKTQQRQRQLCERNVISPQGEPTWEDRSTRTPSPEVDTPLPAVPSRGGTATMSPPWLGMDPTPTPDITECLEIVRPGTATGLPLASGPGFGRLTAGPRPDSSMDCRSGRHSAGPRPESSMGFRSESRSSARAAIGSRSGAQTSMGSRPGEKSATRYWQNASWRHDDVPKAKQIRQRLRIDSLFR